MNLYVLNHMESWGSLFLFNENYLQLYSPHVSLFLCSTDLTSTKNLLLC
jgi:hypothetical protein